jgi:cyclopropane fatty-acyl-phospholipid synthase-like methyltransferase
MILNYEHSGRISNYIIHINDMLIDRILNVGTSKAVMLNEHDNVINFMYEPISYRWLKNLFHNYPVMQDDHLIDFGCGKGRVLIFAAQHGCRHLYGVDISGELGRVATK